MQAEQSARPGPVPEVRPDWLPRAVMSGFIAAVAMLFTFMLAYGLSALVAGLKLRENDRSAALIYNWFHGLTHNSLTDLAGSNLYAFAGLHFVVAIGWALLYARFAEPRLSSSAWTRGLLFSLLPFLISIFIVLPLGGGGILGLALGAGPFPIFGNLILHLVYGATLGAIYGPLGDIPADSLSSAGSADDFETTRRGEAGTAKGILAGLVLGLLVGIVGVILQSGSLSPLMLGVPQAGFVLGITLLGAAFGAFIGSFAGLAAAD